MKYDKKTQSRIYLMQLYFDAYCKKYNLSKEEFLEKDESKGILNSVLALSDDLDYLPIEKGMKELEGYVNE